MEASLAHKPEVRRWKLRSATHFLNNMYPKSKGFSFYLSKFSLSLTKAFENKVSSEHGKYFFWDEGEVYHWSWRNETPSSVVPVLSLCIDAQLTSEKTREVVLYRVWIFRVRVEYESEGVEYESSTSRVLGIHSQKWGSSLKIWCFESNIFPFLLHFY